MKEPAIYRFAGFSLDVRERRLTRSDVAVPVRVKVFDTLVLLVENAGRLLTKEELLSALWPDAVVEENNLNHNISALRKALGEEQAGQRFIETVPRKGYRFVVPVQRLTGGSPAVPAVSAVGHRSKMVARDQELDTLHACFADTEAGKRRLVFITGEAGLGKTTLVNEFVGSRLSGSSAVLHGQCLDHRGEAEPYMPIFEAFVRFCRGGAGDAVIEVIARHAPTWLVQMPALVSPQRIEALQRQCIGATRERMLREMAEAIEALTQLQTIMLVLEDLHWADASTLDLISRLARRPDAARLLLIGTLRPETYPQFHTMVQELTLRGLAQQIQLSCLSHRSIAQLLSRRFPHSPDVEDIAALLHQRTEGNPLFIDVLLTHWLATGLLSEADGVLAAPFGRARLSSETPETLRGLICEQAASLGAPERDLIELASVAGIEFASAAIAPSLAIATEEAERRCAALARRGQFLRRAGQVEWPDGTVSAAFAFSHSLYQEVIYDTVPSGRRVRLHQEIGETLESAYASHPGSIAAALAVHFVASRDVHRAVRYLHLAAANAIQRNAYAEAITQLQRGLRALPRLPDIADRERWELSFQAALGPALVAVRGWADSEAERAYQRALDLSLKLGNHIQRDRMTFGLAAMHELRGHYQRSEALLSSHLQSASGGSVALESHELLACSLFHQGIFRRALDQADRGAMLRTQKAHSELSATFGENPGIGCSTWAALSLWFLGYPDQALARAEEAIRLADQPSNMYGLASVHAQAAMVHQLRREPAAAARSARIAVDLGDRYGFGYRKAIGQVLGGWAVAQQGDVAEGLEMLGQGLAGCTLHGVALDQPYYLALRAESLAAGGDLDGALDSLDAALDQIASLRSFFYGAELYRLRAALCAHRSVAGDQIPEDLRMARELACAQSARSLELRVACEWVRLSRHFGWHDDGLAELARVVALFDEGAGTLDLAQARALLEGRRAPPPRRRRTSSAQ